MCVQCDSTPAGTERKYMHSCKSCVTNVSPEEHYNIVRAESEAYLQKIATQQQWDETAPALQLLFLPKRSGPPLPQYQAEPSYLDPFHCRLCLASVPKGTLQSHLVSAHQISSVQKYRQEVFQRTLAEWPQPITAQILRCNLAAFCSELSDENFKELPMGELRATKT